MIPFAPRVLVAVPLGKVHPVRDADFAGSAEVAHNGERGLELVGLDE
jgi:hypothetical protein